MRRRGLLAAFVVLIACLPVRAQEMDAATRANTQKARATLDAMVKALGGDAWLNMQNRLYEGRRASFYHGNPTGGTVEYWDYIQWPDRQRMEYTKRRDVVQFLIGDEGWEVTYRGKKEWPREDLTAALRVRAHSLETAVKVWLKDPRTVLIYDGQNLVERHLADRVTLISADNDSVDLETDAETHLPLRRRYKWRDPLYKDMNEDYTEYDDYHTVNGIATPFAITSFHNGDMIDQRFLYHASYNLALPPDQFNVDATVAKIKK